jgi:hypothetical protein
MTCSDLVAILGGVALLAFGAGCSSISDSVTSPSRWLADSSGAIADSSQAIADSSNAASDSVSDSSSPDDDDDQAGYRDDVRVATRGLAASGADDEALMRELGRIAERHGLTRWEADPGTWRAVGAGLAEAGRSRREVEALVARLGADAAAQVRAVEGHAAAL